MPPWKPPTHLSPLKKTNKQTNKQKKNAICQDIFQGSRFSQQKKKKKNTIAEANGLDIVDVNDFSDLPKPIPMAIKTSQSRYQWLLKLAKAEINDSLELP